ncbi:MAG: LLM class flavin-dependent oxidoreductase [Actinomycetota bacterium]
MRFALGQFTLQIPPWDSRSPAQLYEDTLELAAFAEEHGFGGFWLAEHHGALDSYIPSLLPFLSAVAARTKTMELGTAVLLAPLHDPLRIAEDVAVVDSISGGRLRLGLGLGWVENEYRMFGIPMKGRGKRLEEFVEILRTAWKGEKFSFNGAHYKIEEAIVTPKPVSVELWLGGGADAAIERAVELADGHFPPSVAGGLAAADRAKQIASLRGQKGLKGKYRYGCFLRCNIDSSAEDAWNAIKDGIMHIQGAYFTWMQGERELTKAKESVAAMEPQIRESAVVGTGAEVYEQMRAISDAIEATGLDDPFISVILAPPGTPLDVAKQRVERFAENVISKLG